MTPATRHLTDGLPSEKLSRSASRERLIVRDLRREATITNHKRHLHGDGIIRYFQSTESYVPLGRREWKKLSIERQGHRTALNRSTSLPLPSCAFHLHKSLKKIGAIVIKHFKLYRPEFL
jgi:hypothetical protein